MITSDVLRRDNPDLLALEVAYRQANIVDTGVWEEFSKGINPLNFRGECQYLAQEWGGMTAKQYQNTYEYLCSVGEGESLSQLKEDRLFGCVTFEWDGMLISRDLLDSVNEIRFLRQTIGLPVSLLDVGPGYGRLLHRLAQTQPAGMYFGIDAVPISTFLCNFYLNYRRCEDSTAVIPLHRYADIHSVDVACNIHSWSECTLNAINFWLGFISDLGVKYLFVVPHDNRWVCCESDGSHPSFKPAIQAHGYRLMREQPKLPSGVDGIYAEAIYTMWKKG